jgi:hypothetical protein
MKKIILGIGALGVMSFTTNQLYFGTQLVYAMNNIQDMKEWIGEDVNNGRMTEEIAEYYYENLDETYGFISDFHEKQCK